VLLSQLIRVLQNNILQQPAAAAALKELFFFNSDVSEKLYVVQLKKLNNIIPS